MYILILIFLSAISYAEVRLVPKEGVTPKKNIVKEYAAEADPVSPHPEVVLRKPKKDRVVQSNTKNKKKSKKAKEVPLSEEAGEDLELIYQQEKEFLESTEYKVMPLNSHPKENQKRAVASIQDPFQDLKEIEKKYKKTGHHNIKIDKQVTQELLERTKNYTGELSFDSEGRLKLAINEPTKSILLINHKNVFMIDYPVDETQNKVQILRSDKPEKLRAQGLLALLVGKQNITDAFEVKELSRTKSEVKYELKPKDKDLQVQVVELVVDLSAKGFKSISYWDDIGNKTSFHFKKYKFSEKSPNGFFDFQQPNNSSVTDI